MSIYTRRPYGDGDLDRILALLNALRAPERRADFPSPADLREMLATDDYRGKTRLWTDTAGAVAGFTILDESHLIFEARPGDLADQMITWAIDTIRQAGGKPPILEVSCLDTDTARIALFEKHGLICEPEGAVHFARPLDRPIPAANLPPGFTLRTTGGDHAAWVALHRAAWGTDNMTLDYRVAMTQVPDYDPALDLVAVAPDGTLAAYCFCYISREENALTGRSDGHTDPIATHPGYQRRGLSRALILEGLRRLKERSVEVACLGTSSDNLPMRRTAESVGFRLVSRTLFYSRTL
jgi:ribosomal protein S18 acetylase RimI-like enzyme